MLGGRRHDVKAVFDALPAGSFWHMRGVKEDCDKYSKDDWEKLERYMDLDTEEP